MTWWVTIGDHVEKTSWDHQIVEKETIFGHEKLRSLRISSTNFCRWKKSQKFVDEKKLPWVLFFIDNFLEFIDKFYFSSTNIFFFIDNCFFSSTMTFFHRQTKDHLEYSSSGQHYVFFQRIGLNWEPRMIKISIWCHLVVKNICRRNRFFYSCIYLISNWRN